MQECLLKARFATGTAAGFELIETMRWEPDAGFVRLDRHLARLYASARELGFAAAIRETIGEALRDAVGGATCRCACGSTLSRKRRRRRRRRSPSSRSPPDTVWTLAHRRNAARLRPTRCSATRRAGATVYDAARAEYPTRQADEVILLNERGEVCEGTITNVFVDIGDGVLLTPPLDCGLLPGVLRGELLDDRQGARRPCSTRADLTRGQSDFRRQFAARADPGEAGLSGWTLQRSGMAGYRQAELQTGQL